MIEVTKQSVLELFAAAKTHIEAGVLGQHSEGLAAVAQTDRSETS